MTRVRTPRCYEKFFITTFGRSRAYIGTHVEALIPKLSGGEDLTVNFQSAPVNRMDHMAGLAQDVVKDRSAKRGTTVGKEHMPTTPTDIVYGS